MISHPLQFLFLTTPSTIKLYLIKFTVQTDLNTYLHFHACKFLFVFIQFTMQLILRTYFTYIIIIAWQFTPLKIRLPFCGSIDSLALNLVNVTIIYLKLRVLFIGGLKYASSQQPKKHKNINVQLHWISRFLSIFDGK